MLPKGHQSHQFVCRNLEESTKISPVRWECPAWPYPPALCSLQLQQRGHIRKPSGSFAKSSSVTRMGGLHPLLALLA